MATSQRILLVEDDQFLITMYSTKLRVEGYEVLMASDGETAWKMIQSEKPALVLLDIMIPKMSGYDVLKHARAESGTKNIPIIMLTNKSSQEEVKQGLDLGANDYLIKAHFMPSEVIAKVKKFLKQE